MRKQTWKPIFLLLLSLALGLLLGWPLSAVRAQATAVPPVEIVAVETTQFPTVQVTLKGSSWPTDRVAAPVQILVNGEPQTITADQAGQQPIGFMVAIDPNEILVSGQERYVEMTGALLNLIENGNLLRNQDWLAAHLLLPTGVQSIQDWTQEPNLVFNSIVQQQLPEQTSTPLTAATLVSALQQFQAGPAAEMAHKVLLLISAGAPDLEVGAVVAAAQAAAVQIHVVELGGQSANASPLAQVAQQSGGDYLALANANALQPLWAQIAAAHANRVLTFQSTVATPASLAVELQLPDGSTLRAEMGAEAFSNLPAAPTPTAVVATSTAVPTPTPAAITQAETQSTIAFTPPVTAGEQVAAAPPAVEAAPVAAVAAPPSDAVTAAPQPPPGLVIIPGLQIGVPRGLLQFGLVVLLGLIGYFGYAEVRDRRKKRNRAAKPYIVPDPVFDLEDNSKPLPAAQFRLQGEDEPPVRNLPPAPPPVRSAPPPPRVAPAAERPPLRPTPLFREDDDEAEPTVRPARMEDDEATYRAQALEQPVVGYLLRTTSDPTLPKELPIYDLKPDHGEVRQIHIGRHSKNNTVVINDKSISREHAVIIQRQGRLYLRDNASTSGTYLNHKLLKPGEELLLRHNDLIGFGQIVYEFRRQGEDEVTIAQP